MWYIPNAAMFLSLSYFSFTYSCCDLLSSAACSCHHSEIWDPHSACPFTCLLYGLGQVTEVNREDNSERLLMCVGRCWPKNRLDMKLLLHQESMNEVETQKE